MQKISRLFALGFVLAFITFLRGQAHPYADDMAAPKILRRLRNGLQIFLARMRLPVSVDFD
jgi:hypothetical protein